MTSQTPYSSAELMTINSARLLRDGDVVFVGVGLPNLACNLARRTHAPNLVMIYEAGVIGAQPARLPLYKAIYDTAYAPAVDFAGRMRRQGVAVHAIEQDITSVADEGDARGGCQPAGLRLRTAPRVVLPLAVPAPEVLQGSVGTRLDVRPSHTGDRAASVGALPRPAQGEAWKQMPSARP